MLTRFVRFLLGAIVALLGLTLTGLLVLDEFVPTNPITGGIKGLAMVLLWDRQAPLSCTGNALMVLDTRTLERGWGPLFDASGHCQLRLQNVRAKAPRIIAAREDARVVIVGGRLEGTTAVLDISGKAVVRVE